MQAKCDFESEIVISGISGRFPKSANLDEFWQNLIDGVDMVGDAQERYNVEEFDVPKRMAVLKDMDKFDAEFFTLHAKQAGTLDPRINITETKNTLRITSKPPVTIERFDCVYDKQLRHRIPVEEIRNQADHAQLQVIKSKRMILEVSYEAVLDAGLNPVEISGSKTGVFAAACDSAAVGIATRRNTPEKTNIYSVFGNVGSMIANRISYFLNLNGPSSVVDTACSSSSVALQQALLSIRAGICDAAIVASANTQHDPVGSHCFHQLKMTSPDGKCKSFDASADGYVRAEAVVAIYICKKQVAKRSYGTLVHAATNCDGYTEQGITYPSEVYQEQVIRQVYDDTGVNPLDVDYLEAHGTGTKVGDPQEMAAVTRVFCQGRKKPLLIGSLKSNMGHPEAVSGLCAIAKVVLSNSKRILPANLHYNNPNPDIPGLHDGSLNVVDKNQPFKPKYVGFNSMGFGGTNVHVLMKFDPNLELESIWNPITPVVLLCSGRTPEAVEIFLNKTLTHRQNHEFVRLTHAIFKHDIHKHGFRGFVVVDQDKMVINVEKRDYAREMWYIVTGLGSQWAGMSRDLVKFDVFKNSIAKTATVLLNNKFDIISLLTCGDPKRFEDFKNSVVSITTIQMALIDLLRSIGIEPDGIVGHSTGEVAAAYADGCLTQEQAALTSFARVRAVLESDLQPGMVASVGLTWENATKRCPAGIWPVIHNGEENVTIAGSPHDIQAFTKQLAGEGVFVKLVRSASFGFHSPLVAESGKLAKILLEEIIRDPKPRSSKWLSSSVPEARWDTDLAKYCSADYYVNNGVNPVYFYPTLKHVPENIVAVEIGPHCFMQSILKKSFSKESVVLGLIHVKSPDNCVYFLDSIGKCYVAGINIDVAELYEPVKFPVPASTPNISSLIQWDHSESFEIPRHTQEISRQKGTKFTFNLQSESDKFLEGHTIDGKILFPATGYIWMAWKCFAQENGFKFENYPVVLENVRFERATFLTNRNETELVINIFNATGKFEVSESDMLVCSGSIRNVDESAESEILNYDCFENVDVSGPYMSKEDFYKELQLRGYGYGGIFQGVEQAHIDGKWAKVKWQGEWVSFIDTILQAFLLQNEKRDLFVPLRIQKLTIDPIAITKHLVANESIMEVRSWKNHNSGICSGLEFRGVKIAKLNQKSRQPPQAIVEARFLPYLNQPSQIQTETAALESSVEIAVDSCFGGKFVFTEILKNPANMIGHVIINESIVKFPIIESRVVNESTYEIDNDKLIAAMSKVTSIQDVQHGNLSHVVFVDDAANISEVFKLVVPGGFVLVKSMNVDLLSTPDVIIISEKRFKNPEKSASAFFLLKKTTPAPIKTQMIDTDKQEYSWVESAKIVLTSLTELDRVYFVSKCAKSGIVGFFKCVIREFTSEKLRCFHIIDNLEFNLDYPTKILLDQLKKDLLMNIYKGETWGTLSNLSIPLVDFRNQRQTASAYANALILGELSSLTWIESPLKNEAKDLVEVCYAALNFRDIMLASGKLSQDALSGSAAQSECVLGLEFAGTYKGRRVCGMGSSDCLATRVDPDKMILLDIPDNWTCQDAATVPCVYITVYLALIMRGRMRPGESVLIHAGSGGVGQAAIQLALSMKCKVFTTVSTKEKREFLKARFPALNDHCISNSRESRDFEGNIHEHTKGRGVDLVLNSLAQDKLFASIRCLAVNGRFLEIGKFDIFNDTNMGMSILSKGVGVFGILADAIMTQDTLEVDQMIDYLQSGMRSGSIRPLTHHVFKSSELETAFRFMAQGKHIGKVLIKVKEEISSNALLLANPKTYFRPNKSYIVIGGLGGMGFELTNWMIQRGATKLVISSRSGQLSGYHEYHINIWKRQGLEILLDNSDVSTFEGSNRLLTNANALAPVGGVFNSAVVLRDAVFNNQTSVDFQTVSDCKAQSTIHMDTLTRQHAPCLDYFVVFSSIITARGNPGQTNYGYANSVMERICEQRKLDGFPALAVQWGAVGDVGVYHRTMKDKNVFGLAPQSLKSCLETLDLFLQQDRPVVSSYIPFYRKEVNAADVSDNLMSIAANILGIKDIKKINPKTPLVELGMDSLMAAELGQVLQSRVNLQLSQRGYSGLTFEKLIEIDAEGRSGITTKISDDFSSSSELTKALIFKTESFEALTHMKSLRSNNVTVFLVHPIDGSLVMVEELVSYLNANVYGLQCSKDAPLESMEKLATFYVSKIITIQPVGPFKIVGYSFGASVAFEMALQLEKRNEKVELVLLDGSPRWKHLTEISGKNDLHEQWENAILVGFLTQYMLNISPVVYKELTKSQPLQDKLNYTAKVLHGSYPDVNINDINSLLASFLARAECGKKYEPSGKIQAKTVLVKAKMTAASCNLPQDYGLTDMCEERLDIIEVEGNHYCFYEKPLELSLPDILNKILQ